MGTGAHPVHPSEPVTNAWSPAVCRTRSNSHIIARMEDYQSVLRTAELGPGAVVRVEAHGEPIALANVGQTYYAVSARCPVDGSDLGVAGRLDGDTIVCPQDQTAYDLRTGARADGASGTGLVPYELRVAGNEVMIGPRRSAD